MQKSTDKQDIKKIQEEIEHRKLVVRKEALEAVEGSPCTRGLGVKTSSTMPQRRIKPQRKPNPVSGTSAEDFRDCHGRFQRG